MNIILHTELKRDNKVVDTLSVALAVEELAAMVKTQGVAAGNKALDKFVAKYTNDLKQKLGAAINQ